MAIRNLISLLIIFGMLRAAIGRLGRIKQKKIKKILGFSSIFSLG
jgi:formate hydrogenlyase subunit 3/multisubunit Na+/H+ antiporter MnhD subunit